MVDVHCHILPAIDDGPGDLPASLEMARAAIRVGITAVAATPHLRVDFPDVRIREIAPRCRSLQAALAKESLELQIIPAGELSLPWALDATEVELRLASFGQRGSCILIETPDFGVSTLTGALHELRLKGYRVLLAHPERSEEFQRRPAMLEDLVRRDVMLQINADALTKSRRSPAARLAQDLCRDGLVTVIASDAHRGRDWRPISALASGHAAAAGLVGEHLAEWMTGLMPAAIVHGTPFPATPPSLPRQGWSRWVRRSREHR